MMRLFLPLPRIRFQWGLDTVFAVLFVLGLILLLALIVWSISDAYRSCKEYNIHLEKTGNRPW